MGFFKWLIIVVVIIIGVYFFFPDTYAKGEGFVTDLWSSDKVQDLLNETSDDSINNSEDSDRESFAQENIHCGWDEQERAYVFDEGSASCAEAEDPDSFCKSNPPLNYDGVIHQSSGSSNPELKCCVPTGDCSWN